MLVLNKKHFCYRLIFLVELFTFKTCFRQVSSNSISHRNGMSRNTVFGNGWFKMYSGGGGILVVEIESVEHRTPTLTTITPNRI